MPPKPKDTAYSATPLPKKLGLVPNKDKALEVVTIAAPDGFIAGLGVLPATVSFRTNFSSQTGLALCFVRSLPELMATLDLLVAKLPRGASAWIIRPKAHHKPGFNEHDVRDAALPLGLVDYKICSVDADWSGIKFAWRKLVG